MKKNCTLFIFILSFFAFSCVNQLSPISNEDEKGRLSIVLPGYPNNRAVSSTDLIIETPESYYISVHHGSDKNAPVICLKNNLKPGSVFELKDIVIGTYTIYVKAESKKNLFEQTKTVNIEKGENKVVINLEHSTGALGFKLTGTEIPIEETIVMTFKNKSQDFYKQIEITDINPDGTFNIYNMPEGNYTLTVAPGENCKYKYSETVEVKKGKMTSFYSIEAIPDTVFYIDSDANSSSELGSANSPFKTIDKAIEKMEMTNLKGGTIYIKGSIPASLVFDTSSIITNLVIEKAPGATTAELVTKTQKPIIDIGTPATAVNISIKGVTLRTDSTISPIVKLNTGTCSLTDVELKAASIKGCLIDIEGNGNLKLGGTITVPDNADIINMSATEEIPGDIQIMPITITSPLTVTNKIRLSNSVGKLKTGLKVVVAENGVNLATEKDKFILDSKNSTDFKFAIDESGNTKKSHVPIYIETDTPSINSCKINGKTYTTEQTDFTKPKPIKDDSGIYFAPIGTELQIEITSNSITQKHKITPIETKDNIIKFYTSRDVYVSTTGSDTYSGLSTNPVKTVSKAVELMEEKILTPTLVSSTSHSSSAPSIILTGNQTFTEKAPIKIEKAVKFEIVNIDSPDIQNATISNGTTDNEIFIIDNPNADITIGNKITLASDFASNSTKCLIKLVHGNLNIEQNCVVGYKGTNMNGIYVSNGATVKIKGISTESSPSILPINQPIYLENGASIIADFGKIDRYQIKIILADDYDKSQQIVKPISGSQLTQDQADSFMFVTNTSKNVSTKYQLETSGKISEMINYYVDGSIGSDIDNTGSKTSPFGTITKVLSQMEANRESNCKIYITGSVKDSISFMTPSYITNVTLEKEPNAATAEIVAKDGSLSGGPSSKEKIIMIEDSNLVLSLKNVNLKSDSNTDNMITIKEGTCSLYNAEILIPDGSVSDSSASIINVAPGGKLKLGGKFNLPLSGNITLSAEVAPGYLFNPSNLIIFETLNTSNNINMYLDCDLSSGTQFIYSENNVELSKEVGKFKLKQTNPDNEYFFDDSGYLKATYGLIYIESDISGTSSCEIAGKTYTTDTTNKNQKQPIKGYKAEYNTPVSIKITFNGSEIQNHTITPKENEDNIIYLNTIKDFYVSTSGSDYGTGTNDSPFKSVSKAVELIMAQATNPTLTDDISSTRYNVYLKDAGDFVETKPIKIESNVNITISPSSELSSGSPKIINGTSELLIINSPKATVTIYDKINLLARDQTLSGSSFIEVQQGNLNLLYECAIGLESSYTNTELIGIHLYNGSNLTILCLDDMPINQTNTLPIYLENNSTINAEYFTIPDKSFKLILADDFDKSQQIIIPRSTNTELTNEQISNFCFVTMTDKENPTGDKIDKTGHFVSK